MSVFIKRPRGTSAKDKLRRELQNTVYAGKILGDMVPDVALGVGKDELEFGYLGPRNEFLDKRLTEDDDLIDDALVEVADALATLHSRSSDVKATPERAPSVPLNINQLDSISEEVMQFICRTDDKLSCDAQRDKAIRRKPITNTRRSNPRQHSFKLSD
ncbi:hypothetical protein ABEQ49_04955 [Cutibacterium acnes]